MSVLDTLWEGLSNALLMAWTVWWALVFGFAISAVVQAWVPRERIEQALGGRGPRPIALATGLGAASSSCSYAAVAIARALFARGASAVSALAFQFASTNLLGGLLLIVIMALLLRLFVSRGSEQQAREHAERAEPGHQHHSAGAQISVRERLTSVAAWSDVAHNFRNDWSMLYREIATGFVLAGFIGLLGDRFFNDLFLVHEPAPLRLIENVSIGPLIAVLSFVCSVGNIPLAAVLWSGGIGFAGVIAFIFADLIVLPIIAIYRKYYGTSFALKIVALMLLTMILAALAVDGLFSAAGLIPHARPTRAEIFPGVKLDYKLVTNVFGAIVFLALFALTLRRGASDPICGMQVDRDKAIVRERAGRRYYFCSEHCAAEFDAQPSPAQALGASAAPRGG
jgi:uncharacterized membrane protein YraQ (UPF0718 family)/YHS domain-containing protein